MVTPTGSSEINARAWSFARLTGSSGYVELERLIRSGLLRIVPSLIDWIIELPFKLHQFCGAFHDSRLIADQAFIHDFPHGVGSEDKKMPWLYFLFFLPSLFFALIL